MGHGCVRVDECLNLRWSDLTPEPKNKQLPFRKRSILIRVRRGKTGERKGIGTFGALRAMEMLRALHPDAGPEDKLFSTPHRHGFKQVPLPLRTRHPPPRTRGHRRHLVTDAGGVLPAAPHRGTRARPIDATGIRVAVSEPAAGWVRVGKSAQLSCRDGQHECARACSGSRLSMTRRPLGKWQNGWRGFGGGDASGRRFGVAALALYG